MKIMSWLPAFGGLFSFASIAYAQGQHQGYGMWPGMGWGWGMGWPWPIMMFVFWIAVIVGVVFLVRWVASSNRCRGGASEESALDILKKRYAKGEINKDEYEKIKKDIS